MRLTCLRLRSTNLGPFHCMISRLQDSKCEEKCAKPDITLTYSRSKLPMWMLHTHWLPNSLSFHSTVTASVWNGQFGDQFTEKCTEWLTGLNHFDMFDKKSTLRNLKFLSISLYGRLFSRNLGLLNFTLCTFSIMHRVLIKCLIRRQTQNLEVRKRTLFRDHQCLVAEI